METKNLSIGGLILLLIISFGGNIYEIYDDDTEITCRTGNGWTIITEHDGYSDAVCMYKTKDAISAQCSSFRATNSYERYGCNSVTVFEVEKEVIQKNSGIQWNCGICDEGDCCKAI